ncbi:MAG: FAD-dependent oxidoreductase [Lewinellaceae bacterium]|nr:FAD-dependent oxidoreductase [Lewinellaceae bacterium]
MCGILGVSLPFQPSFSSCQKDETTGSKFSGKVIIIGAGAGGLSAGYLLQQQGVDFELLEASSMHGGRMRINTNFADFPIPLGAEWLETDTSVFKKIVNDASVQVNVETIADDPDRKFVNSSWFTFFETYITPAIANKIIYNSIVKSIDYAGDQVVVTTQSGQHIADKVIVSVPLKILQTGDIRFIPNLPQDKRTAIDNMTIWEGFKAFFEFSEKFYDDELALTINPASDGQKIYYNAALGQRTTRYILGLFTVGKPAIDFISRSGEALKDFILHELDLLYANQATPNYIKHITQNWNNEPFIQGGYLTDYADWRMVRKLGENVGNKLYFAGGEYTDGEDWVSVHTAAQSAKTAVAAIVN